MDRQPAVFRDAPRLIATDTARYVITRRLHRAPLDFPSKPRVFSFLRPPPPSGVVEERSR
jgi:hypothetical protein